MKCSFNFCSNLICVGIVPTVLLFIYQTVSGKTSASANIYKINDHIQPTYLASPISNLQQLPWYPIKWYYLLYNKVWFNAFLKTIPTTVFLVQTEYTRSKLGRSEEPLNSISWRYTIYIFSTVAYHVLR